MNPHFTIDGSPALEAQLAATCRNVLSGVRAVVPAAELEGLLLGGGYGRGEGGVLKSADGDLPYNDLEYYVFVAGNAMLAERKFRHPLHELGERLSPAAGLEVEFKVLTLDKLRRSAPNMFYYDLVAGHRWQLGDDTLLAGCEQHGDAATIPAHEATRLLLNRCSGLLYSAARLARVTFGPADADFVGRNLAKAQLAYGDALLTAHGQYHWSCRERQVRLARLAGVAELPLADMIRHHEQGVEFKLHPTRSQASRAALALRHRELKDLGRQLWLWLESRRLHQRFATPHDYAFTGANLCPETSPWRNRLINCRAFGPSGLTWTRYPRERLFRALALLLWETEGVARVQSELRTTAPDFAGLVSAYEQLWRRFN